MPTHYDGTQAELRALNAYIKLIRCTNTIHAALQRRVESHGLTENQFGVLEALLHLGPMNQRMLARKLLTAGGNITMVVDHLERKGLIERNRSTVDRRSITVSLTAKGRKRISEMFPNHVREIVEKFRPLTPSEQAQLGVLCRKLGLANARQYDSSVRRPTK